MFGLTPYEHRIDSLENFFDSMENAFFGNHSFMSDFKTDVIDNGDHLVLEAELPGFDKKDIAIDVSNGYLTISAQRNVENKEEDKDGKWIKRERSYGAYHRSFDLNGIDADHISASYDNGVLSLKLPKASAPKEDVRRIELQ